MTAKKEDTVSKERVRILLKEGFFLGNYRYESVGDKIVEELREDRNDLEKKILASHHGYQAISKRLEEEQKKLDRWSDQHRKRVDKLRRDFFSKGLTPSVLKAIQDYADELNQSQ